jgi:hypothetical protein
MSGSWLIDYQLSSDAGDGDGNNNSTPGIHGPIKDGNILIEENAVDACLGLSSNNRLIFISDIKDDNEDNSKKFVRIQGANLRRFDKYKKRLHLTTAPPWYNCKKCTIKQECIGWMGKHPLPLSVVHNAAAEVHWI